jgi:hypothetical protein
MSRCFLSSHAKTLIEDRQGTVSAEESMALTHAKTIAADCASQGVLEGCTIVVTRDGETSYEFPMSPWTN